MIRQYYLTKPRNSKNWKYRFYHEKTYHPQVMKTKTMRFNLLRD